MKKIFEFFFPAYCHKCITPEGFTAKVYKEFTPKLLFIVRYRIDIHRKGERIPFHTAYKLTESLAFCYATDYLSPVPQSTIHPTFLPV